MKGIQISVKSNSEFKKPMDFRGEDRTNGQKNASVEFTPGNDAMTYHFRLKDFSTEGFGILVRKDSKVLQYIKPGDVLAMKFHPDRATADPVHHYTKIKHISEPMPGKNQDHLVVGLLILE